MILLGSEGQIGRAIKHYFSLLGIQVTTVDCVGEPDIKGDFREILPKLKGVVMSAMPYHQNLDAAKIAIDRGMSYYDLGGHTQTTEKISQYACDSKVFPGLGLAPGHVNALAEKLYRESPYEYVNMYCGGLPEYPSYSCLNYKCTWSIDGLVNEYFNEYKHAQNGYVKSFPLDHPTEKPFESYSYYECAHTSGCTDLQVKDFAERKVDLNYYTLRYNGHFSLFRQLYKINPEIVKQVLNYESKYHGDDIVDICLETDKGFVYSQRYYASEFTAMQKTTAAGFVSGVLALERSNKVGLMSYMDFDDEYFTTFDRLVNHDSFDEI